MASTIKPHVCNETDSLHCVVVGLPHSLGTPPTLEETYDARSYRAVEEGNYPIESDIVEEMEQLATTLEREGIEVLRPTLIPDYNQLFARDVAFTIDEELFIANMIPEREKEILAYREVFSRIPDEQIVHLPKEVHAEGGDIMLYNDILFMGVTPDKDFDHYKMARTNEAAIRYFTSHFPQKKVIPLQLKKHDSNPEKGVLHLDCAFQPVGRGKALYYPQGFARQEEVELIESIFGKENLFAITAEEAFNLTTNIFSISPNRIIVENEFHRLRAHLENEWNISTISIPYYEISKQGGLLRCSTCPLIRQ